MHCCPSELVRFAWLRRGPVLVDGRSGAGKSTLAEQLADRGPHGTRLIHLDDLYRGWNDLEATSRRMVSLISRCSRRYRRWDWSLSLLADEVRIPPAAPLVIEGSGAITRQSARLSSCAIWVDAPVAVRRYRALRRDGSGYADGEYWNVWQAQEQRHLRLDSPEILADVSLTWGDAGSASLTYRCSRVAPTS
ncbi:MAG: ATP-binding protein [Microbacteriaceae bacterium]|nr:ATP-binding protein [Microbacteriaceae bacterium]MCI1207122.1 ATP-binding protein [Microbacteriaceae bacterium]